MLSAALVTWLAAATPPGEALPGFTTVLVKQINAVVGSENLPAAMGAPVPPGLYVTLAPTRTVIFDEVAGTIADGRYTDAAVAAESASGCPRVIFDAFHFRWSALVSEAAALGLDVPATVVFAAHRDLSAAVLVQTAYAAAETRPGPVPALALVLNGGSAGVRARPFLLLPPRGLTVSSGQRVLGLTVTAEAGGRYTITAADPRFGRTLQADATALEPVLADLKKHYPSKETIIVQPSGGATVEDVVRLMVAAQEHFPRVVLSGGQRVRVAG
jgi:hypothetical protein